MIVNELNKNILVFCISLDFTGNKIITSKLSLIKSFILYIYFLLFFNPSSMYNSVFFTLQIITNSKVLTFLFTAAKSSCKLFNVSLNQTNRVVIAKNACNPFTNLLVLVLPSSNTSFFIGMRWSTWFYAGIDNSSTVMCLQFIEKDVWLGCNLSIYSNLIFYFSVNTPKEVYIKFKFYFYVRNF